MLSLLVLPGGPLLELYDCPSEKLTSLKNYETKARILWLL